MPKARNDLDRSVAFTILLDVMPGYAESPEDGGRSITNFLTDWYNDPSLDMYEFARRWVTTPDTFVDPDTGDIFRHNAVTRSAERVDTPESETEAILADPDVMAAIAEAEAEMEDDTDAGIALTFTPEQLRLLWLGTETLLDANPDDSAAQSLDAKVTAAVKANAPLMNLRPSQLSALFRPTTEGA